MSLAMLCTPCLVEPSINMLQVTCLHMVVVVVLLPAKFNIGAKWLHSVLALPEGHMLKYIGIIPDVEIMC